MKTDYIKTVQILTELNTEFDYKLYGLNIKTTKRHNRYGTPRPYHHIREHTILIQKR